MSFDTKTIRGRQNFAIPSQWLLDLLRATQGYQTKQDLIIPKDAEIKSVNYNEQQDCIILALDSKDFPVHRPFGLIQTVIYGGALDG